MRVATATITINVENQYESIKYECSINVESVNVDKDGKILINLPDGYCVLGEVRTIQMDSRHGSYRPTRDVYGRLPELRTGAINPPY